jgi:hypothetical protein
VIDGKLSPVRVRGVAPEVFQPQTDNTIQGTGSNVAFCGLKQLSATRHLANRATGHSSGGGPQSKTNACGVLESGERRHRVKSARLDTAGNSPMHP